MRPTATAIAGVSALLLSLSLTACQGSNAPVSSQAASPAATDALARPGDPTGSTEQTGPTDLTDPTQPQEPARPTEAAQPDAPECSGLTGEEALAAWGPDVPIYNDWPWWLEGADTSTYDECADLSWITLEIEGATASSPVQIMLFHRGEYIGTTASEPIGFYPDVVRVDDATIEVTYTWPKEGEANAEASGSSVSVFTWSETEQRVIHSGEWPPGHGDARG